MLVPALKAPQVGLMLMAHLQQRPPTQGKDLSHLLLFNGAAIYNAQRSPLPATEAPAGIDPKHGSDWARHIPIFIMPL